MKILAVLGSPRPEGNTARVLGWVEHALRTMGHTVERMGVAGRQFSGCIECFACQRQAQPRGCTLQDDATPILEGILQADGVILATPLFGWGFAGQLKLTIDRYYGYGKGTPYLSGYRSLLEGKRYALLVTAAGPARGNADLIEEAFERMSRLAKFRIVGTLIVPFANTIHGQNVQARCRAEDFARRIVE